MALRKFKAKLDAEGGGVFFCVPFDVKETFGKARAPVRVTLGRHSYRSTVAVYGGKYFVPVRREHREAAGVLAGSTIAVTLELDDTARKVEVPPDLAAALRKTAHAKARWDKLSYSHQREHIEAIVGAKKPETRARRIAKAVASLPIGLPLARRNH